MVIRFRGNNKVHPAAQILATPVFEQGSYLEVWSRRGAIQIHIYLTLPYLTYRACWYNFH